LQAFLNRKNKAARVNEAQEHLEEQKTLINEVFVPQFWSTTPRAFNNNSKSRLTRATNNCPCRKDLKTAQNHQRQGFFFV